MPYLNKYGERVTRRGVAILPDAIQTPFVGRAISAADDAQKVEDLRNLRISRLRKARPRGTIKSLSRASVARLREKLALAYIPNGIYYACTLTFCTDRPPEWFAEKFRDLQHYFTVTVRSSPILRDCAIIWRVELQQNQTPHLHLLLLAKKEISGESIYFDMLRVWRKVHNKYHLWSTTNADFFLTRSVRFEDCETLEKVKRYQSDHMSKHKKQQLGIAGRQWGIINNRLLRYYEIVEEFPASDSSGCCITDNQLRRNEINLYISRLLRRYMRYRIRDNRKPFGSKKSSPKLGYQKIIFTNLAFVTRLRQWCAEKKS